MAFSLTRQSGKFLTHFGETIVYKPNGGAPRSIKANVQRNVYEAPSEIPGDSPAAPSIIIDVRNSYTDGIHSEEVDRGQDKVELAVRVGETPMDRPIADIISQDDGMLQLVVH